ncbi:UNVERIFIED_CONTAM: hypothetical protein FKN15_064051 [Acipenser sinensis]
MSTKAPIYLKRGSRRGKKEKLRDILSSDMISPPLGDFRHTIHIGSSGGESDLFGDLSFLQGKFHLLPGKQGHSLSQRCNQYGTPFEFTRTASVCAHPPQRENSSPLLKNALSLPVIGGVQALSLPAAQQVPPPKPPRLHLEATQPPPPTTFPVPLLPQFPTPSPDESPSPIGEPRSPEQRLAEPRIGLTPEDTPVEEPFLSHAGSLLSLHLDLGPSILDDVLQIMDKHQVSRINGSQLHESRAEILS